MGLIAKQNENEPFKMYECPICGKKFIPPVGTIYKTKVNDKMEILCSYTCYSKAKKKNEEGKKDRVSITGY